MPEKCRNCRYWYSIPPWQGNCKLHPTSRPQWSEDASPQDRGCSAFAPTHVPDPHRPGCLIKVHN